MTSLIRPVFLPVSVLSVSVVDTFLRFVAIAMPCFVGLGLIFRLFALYEFSVHSAMYVGVMAALKKFLEFEHVCLDYSVFFGILNVMGPWLSEEHLWEAPFCDGGIPFLT